LEKTSHAGVSGAARRRRSPWTSGRNRSIVASTMLTAQVDRNEPIAATRPLAETRSSALWSAFLRPRNETPRIAA
jgi:hypothetical protein